MSAERHADPAPPSPGESERASSGSGLSPELLDAAVILMGRSGRGATVRVQGRSMEPTLRGGQLLAVEFGPPRLRTGDMVLFRRLDHLVVHRYLNRARRADGRPYLRTRGDGLPYLDPPVDPDRVVGRVVAVQADGGWRSVRGGVARLYAFLLAWHDLLWALAGTAARLGERGLRRLRCPLPLGEGVTLADRWLLRRVHGPLFHRVHRPIAEPEEAREPAD